LRPDLSVKSPVRTEWLRRWSMNRCLVSVALTPPTLDGPPNAALPSRKLAHHTKPAEPREPPSPRPRKLAHHTKPAEPREPPSPRPRKLAHHTKPAEPREPALGDRSPTPLQHNAFSCISWCFMYKSHEVRRI